MTIEIHTPELEQRVMREIQNGHFHDVDELLTRALDALEKERPHTTQRRLIDVLSDSVFAGSDLLIQRQKDYPRPADL